METTNPAAVTPEEKLTRDVLAAVQRCRNGIDRFGLMGCLMRPDHMDHALTVYTLIESGLLRFGTDNAMARAWGRGYVESCLYLTKAGRYWLKTRAVEIARIESDEFAAKLIARRAAREAAEAAAKEAAYQRDARAEIREMQAAREYRAEQAAEQTARDARRTPRNPEPMAPHAEFLDQIGLYL